MKKCMILMAILCLAFGTTALADIPLSSVPQAVNQNFQQKFSGATDVEWEKRWASSTYEVEFEIGQIDYKALYNSNGTLQRYWHKISLAELPKAVQQAVTANYPSHHIDDASKLYILSGSTETIQYRVELDTDATLKSDKQVIVSADGKIVSSSND